MKFTRLRILGFKSFVEPTEFLIEPGLTGIVGPNGCGKSNLVEALRWVMGESSYKNMRASGMDDVIFSGSLNRPARNTAEVTLSVDNSQRLAPTAFNEAEALEVTRRIEREAGSAYKINGRDVRARDVQLLFADASTGAHSPAIVGQGKIGELIAAKPQARRSLLEEAAGISGLHNRRHEAELRLRAAEQNLERIDDVISEIQTQHDMLKRQARQAVRYRNLSGEIRRAEATVLHLRWLAANTALGEAEAALQAALQGVNQRSEEQAVAARTQAEAAGVLPQLRDTAARANAALQRITVARETLEAEEQRVLERVEELDRRLTQLADDIGREERMLADNGAILSRLDEEESELEAAIATTAERELGAAARRQNAELTLRESEAALAARTEEHAHITAARSQFERALSDADERAKRLEAQAAEVEAELANLDVAAASLPAIASRQSAVEGSESSLRTAEQAASDAEVRTASSREGQTVAREALAEAERGLERMKAEASTLASLLSKPTDSAEPIIDLIEVAPGFEAALGAAFGDDLDAPTDETAAVHWRNIVASTADPALPFGVEPLADRVKAPAEISRGLRQVGIVARTEGPQLQRQLHPGQRLVSHEGDLWRWDGFTATAEAASASAQRLASRNRLAALENEIVGARELVERQKLQLEATTATLRAAGEEESRTRAAWRDAQRALDAARAALADAEREQGRIDARRSAIDETRNHVTTSLADVVAARTAAREGLASTPEPGQLNEQIETLRGRVDEDRGALAEARAAVENLVREAEVRTGRLAAIAVERRTWHERAANAEAQITTLSSRRTESETERARLAEEPARIEAQRVALFSEIESAEKVRAEAADRLAEGETALAEADKIAREALDGLAEAREQRGRAEERVVAAKERRDEVAARIAEALDCEPDAAVEQAELKPDAQLPDLTDTEARLERYKQERERLGAVNLRAEAEAAELAERRDALTGERDDLVAAIQRLRHGISSLNREGRERLTGAFDTVNDHFQRLFTHLFGGGQAELQLIDSDDPLEAGLEIVARPPGKKPQIMTLLSGGEQALTALALIFAVFLTNPAPICVLDEVDAPLDDANIERFCNLLDEMTRQTDTRFTVITHNPITMARMSRLFGVTMAERGVSQLVSVDLETAESFLEAV